MSDGNLDLANFGLGDEKNDETYLASRAKSLMHVC